MKNIILLISICANVLLGFAYWFRAKPSANSVNPVSIEQPKSAAKTKMKSITNTVAAAARSLDWQSVESGDYEEYIANLRSIGCPEKTIRDIIIADVSELFKQRAKSQESPKRFEYWKAGNPLAGLFDEEAVAKNKELAAEKRELLKTLLGENFAEDASFASLQTSDPMEQMLDFLKPEQRTAMNELEQEFAGKLMKTVKDASRGDTGAMQKILAEKDAAMLKILSPEEKFEYDLRLSQTAMIMRMGMGDFEPSEQEFREMFKLQKEHTDKYGMTGFGNRGGTVPASAKEEFNNKMKAAMGEERFQHYQMEQRWAFDPLQNVAKEHNVPKQTAVKVYKLQTAAEAEAAKVRANDLLSPEQKKLAFEEMRRATEKAVGEVLGASATEAYLKKTAWLNNLK